MKIAVEQDALVNTMAAVARLYVDPYREFVTQLAMDGRVQPEEVDQLNTRIRRQTDKVQELVAKGLKGDSDQSANS